MLADRAFGTYWDPADPLPQVWEGAADIPQACPTVYGSFAASTYRTPQAVAARAAAVEAARARKGGGGGGGAREPRRKDA